MTYAHDAAAIDAAAGSSWNLDTFAESRGWTGVAIVAGVTNSRDAHAYDQSNFAAAVKLLAGQDYRDGAGDTSYGDSVAVASLRSPFVGWVEFLTFDAGEPTVRAAADDIAARLARYPLLDEIDAGEREYESDHPRGTDVGEPCYADADADCHATDDMGRILAVCERCAEPLDDDAEPPYRCALHPVYLDPAPGQIAMFA